jgi:Tfp pilus assembly protein PilV
MMLRVHQIGLSYVEALLAVFILGVALVPALELLQIAFVGSDVQESSLRLQLQTVTRMEVMLAEPFGSLDAAAQAAGNATTPSSYSDIAGTVDRTLVFLSRYDGDNADGDNDPYTGTDEGLLWIQVAIEDRPYEISTLVAQ